MGLKKLFAVVTLVMLPTIVAADEATDMKINALDVRIQRIERVVDNQALLSMVKRIETLQREVQELRGENERLTHELNNLKTHQEEQHLNTDYRLNSSSPVPNSASALSANTEVLPNDTVSTQIDEATQNTDIPPASSVVATPSQVATTSGTTLPIVASAEVTQDYKHAFTLLKQGKYDDSIIAFEAYLLAHPGSKYAANAQYWLAEANYVFRRYPQALLEFSKVVNQYPASSKVADARLKLGFTHYELGQYEEARIELTRLRAQFPNSSVASLAQQRLERMSREGHQ